MGDPLAGIVLKPPALSLDTAQSLFCAEDLCFFHLRAEFAVSAGTFYFFSKQHGGILLTLVASLYTSFSGNATIFS